MTSNRSVVFSGLPVSSTNKTDRHGATVWSILTFPGLYQNSDNTDEIRPEIQNITFLRSSNLNDIRTITLHVDGIRYIIKGELEYIAAIKFETVVSVLPFIYSIVYRYII